MKIARPCTENLDTMARTAGGGFACTRCELDVVDLRRATKKRALAVLSELRAGGGRVCARVRAKPDGTPLFYADPSRLARFAAPVALATALAACSPATSMTSTATPVTLSHESTAGNNANGPMTPVVVAPVARVTPPTAGTTNVAVQPELEMAGEMAW